MKSMTFVIGLWLLSSLCQAADEHAGHAAAAVDEAAAAQTGGQEPPVSAVPPEARQQDSAAMQEARHMNLMAHGGTLNWLLLGERLERHDNDSLVWEGQGWLGGDIHKAWFKTEGLYDTAVDSLDGAEFQALYSRAVAPFLDVQAGVRHDSGRGPDRSYAVLGLMGLAPFWFELDSAVFLSERGDPSARLEAEYELRFTQKLLLQPRLELNYSFADDEAAGVGKGLSEASFGLRLRYEVRREFAPYVGLEWSRAFGNTASLMSAAGDDREQLNVVAGVRVWY